MISLEKVFKEILPIYSRYMTMDISVLPAEVLSKIASYCIGKPEDIRLKHNKGLKQIQKRYRQIYRGLERDVGYCDDDESMYEFYVYKLKSNNKGMSRIDDILKEVGYIKSIINNSHIRYIQPDMHCNVHIRIDCVAKMNENDSPTDFTYDTSDVCFYYPDFKEDGEFNVKYTIEDLHATLKRELGYFACSREDDVIIENLYVSMCIVVNTEKYIEQK